MIRFTIPGKPTPKARPRVIRGGWTYTPAKTKKYENLVKMAGLCARETAKLSISGGYFSLDVVCYGSHPRSDWDNLGKAISDALNGILWNDDSQVIDGRVRKLKCEKGHERTEVTVAEAKV